MGIICFRVEKIPDLSLKKYQSIADTGVEGVLNRHESFLRQWHGICADCNASFHLIYVFSPLEIIGERLKLYFAVRGSESNLQFMEPLLMNSPLSEFFDFSRAELPRISFEAGVTMTKTEVLADILNPLTNQINTYHYVPKWEVNRSGRLYDLFKIMESIGESYTPQKECAFRVDLYPASQASDTRKQLNPILSSLNGNKEIKLINGIDSLKDDSYAKDISKEYHDWISKVETSLHFRANIYAYADSVFKAKVVLNAAASEALSEGEFSLTPLKAEGISAFDLTSRMEDKAFDYCYYPQAAVLKTWPTTFCLSEILPFFRFPALYDGENIEISKETRTVYEKSGIYLGKDINNYSIYFALEDVPKHAFFTGMPGSGKTNTMLHFITELKKFDIPFLVLEPSKKEYRTLLGYREMKNVYLFSPHIQSHFPLHMNPLEFPTDVRLSQHINALLEVFEGSFTLEGPTYTFLSAAIQKSYVNLGWDLETVNSIDSSLPYPTLKDVYDNLEDEIDKSSYDSEIKGNVRAFLQVRLGGLMERDAGEVFGAHFSTLSPDEWIKSSAIVELEMLGEQAKNFFVLLVCHYILESIRANPVLTECSNNEVRHVVFIEEAHNIIASQSQQDGADIINPKISATAYIVKMLAEVRALKEGIVIADQLPTALTSEVTKNTGLKIVHRLTSKDDREQICSSISATPLQMEQVASYTKGKGLIHNEKTIKPFEIQIAECKNHDNVADFSCDESLYISILDRETMRHTIEASLINLRQKYVFSFGEKIEKMNAKIHDLSDKDLIGNPLIKIERSLLWDEHKEITRKIEYYDKLLLVNDNSKNLFGDLFDDIRSDLDLHNKYLEKLL